MPSQWSLDKCLCLCVSVSAASGQCRSYSGKHNKIPTRSSHRLLLSPHGQYSVVAGAATGASPASVTTTSPRRLLLSPHGQYSGHWVSWQLPPPPTLPPSLCVCQSLCLVQSVCVCVYGSVRLCVPCAECPSAYVSLTRAPSAYGSVHLCVSCAECPSPYVCFTRDICLRQKWKSVTGQSYTQSWLIIIIDIYIYI